MHNGKRSGGDKSGDMIIKRQRVDEEMQVAFERNVNINQRKQETNERKQRMKELEKAIDMAVLLELPQEEIRELRMELYKYTRGELCCVKSTPVAESTVAVPKVQPPSVAVETSGQPPSVAEKTAVQEELCCCGCGNNVAESAHFCAKTNRRILAFCVPRGSRCEEGYGSINLCGRCAMDEAGMSETY